METDLEKQRDEANLYCLLFVAVAIVQGLSLFTEVNTIPNLHCSEISPRYLKLNLSKERSIDFECTLGLHVWQVWRKPDNESESTMFQYHRETRHVIF